MAIVSYNSKLQRIFLLKSELVGRYLKCFHLGTYFTIPKNHWYAFTEKQDDIYATTLVKYF